MAKWSFCHGWTVDARKGFCEVTCKRRETCAYYSVDFYRKYGDHLDDFEEMFPMEPCEFYTPRATELKQEEEKPSIFDFLKDDSND